MNKVVVELTMRATDKGLYLQTNKLNTFGFIHSPNKLITIGRDCDTTVYMNTGAVTIGLDSSANTVEMPPARAKAYIKSITDAFLKTFEAPVDVKTLKSGATKIIVTDVGDKLLKEFKQEQSTAESFNEEVL